jgi:HD superfamily phosphodiesterase
VKAAEDYERKNPVLDWDLLDVKEEDRKWFRDVNIAVRDSMNGPKYDVSHNYQHARRVVGNGKYILERESKRHQWTRDIDPLTVYLGCLVHDIGDRKYREADEDRDQRAIVAEFLIEHGVPSLASRLVAHLVSHVSFTLEMHSREAIAAVAK